MEYKIFRPSRASGTAPVTLLGNYVVQRRGRFWAVFDAGETLICLTVYKRGALEVARRLGSMKSPS